MKLPKILSLLVAPLVLLVLTINCTNEDDAITYSLTDVSSRVTGFGTEKAGTGAPLVVNGTGLDKVVRIVVGTQSVAARAFTSVSESSITFNVPSNAVTGDDQRILFVFPGSERATKTIEVISFQSVSDFVPRAASVGDSVTIIGGNLDVVTEVKLGSAAAGFDVKSPSALRFKVPEGFTSDLPITLVSEAGASNTATSLVSCTGDPTSADCAEGLTLNNSFELGSGDDFTNWSKFNGGTFMTATTVPSEVYRGNRAVKVVKNGTLGDGQWRLQLASDLILVEPGASYTVYVWAKGLTAGGSMRVSTNPDAKYTADQAITTQWQRLAFTFSPTGGNAIAITDTRIVLDMNGNATTAATFFIDDVKLVKN